MQYIGEYLKEVRKKKNVEINSISKELNIPQDIITKIENDDFETYIDNVYLTGHIRVYAKYLNLDSDEIVKKFKIQTSFLQNENINEIPIPISKNNFFFAAKGISFFSILFLSVGFYYFFIRSNDLQPSYSIIPDIPENFESTIEKEEMNLAMENKILEKSEELSDDNMLSKIEAGNIYFNYDLQTTKPSQVIASLPPDKVINNENISITLKFLESTWFQIRNNKEDILASELMEKNSEYSYFLADNYFLTVGNAGNIMILINGETRGKLGKKGEVIESLFIDSSFEN